MRVLVKLQIVSDGWAGQAACFAQSGREYILVTITITATGSR